MLTSATLTVNFAANYAGSHRICWRIQGSGNPYVCTNLVTCVGGGNVCSAVISIMVDPESCTPVTYEGYIQATCNDVTSPVDQVPWVSTFVPNPACAKYRVMCDAGPGSPCGPITSQELGLNCDGTIRPAVDVITGPNSFFLCNTGIIPNLPVDYIMTLDTGCCYDCASYEIPFALLPGGVLAGTTIYYTDCNTRQFTRVDVDGLTPNPFLIPCAVVDSIYVEYDPLQVSVNINNLGACP